MWKPKTRFLATNEVICPHCGHSKPVSQKVLGALGPVMEYQTCDVCKSNLKIVFEPQVQVEVSLA